MRELDYGYKIGGGSLITSTATASNPNLGTGYYILQWTSGTIAINLLGEATVNDYTISEDNVETPILEVNKNNLSIIGDGTFRAIKVLF